MKLQGTVSFDMLISPATHTGVSFGLRTGWWVENLNPPEIGGTYKCIK